jgi:hypothetical protein
MVGLDNTLVDGSSHLGWVGPMSQMGGEANSHHKGLTATVPTRVLP